MSGDLGNAAQARAIADQVADAAIARFGQMYPAPTPPAPAEVPAPLKWAAAIIAAILTAGSLGLCIWVVTTLSDLQQIVTRIDERQQLTVTNLVSRMESIDERLTRIERQEQERRNGEDR